MSLEDSIIALANAITQQTALLKQMASAPVRAASQTTAGSLAEENAPTKGKGRGAAKSAAKVEEKEPETVEVEEVEEEVAEEVKPALPTTDDVNAALAVLIGTKPPRGKEVAVSIIKRYSPETGKLGGVDPLKYAEFIAAVNEAAQNLNAQEDAPADPLGDL